MTRPGGNQGDGPRAAVKRGLIQSDENFTVFDQRNDVGRMSMWSEGMPCCHH